jgi:lipopolysaccharide heptosyltransferase II
MQQASSPAGTLFIRFSSLGDIILAEPAVRAYKAQRPDSRIDFLTKKAFGPVVDLFPGVDRVITAPEPLSALALYRFRNFLKGEGYAAVVDLHRNLRSYGASLFLAGERFGYPRASLKRRLMAAGLFRGESVEHTAARYQRALGSLAPQSSSPGILPVIELSRECRERASEILGSHGWREGEKLAAIIPGARWPAKRWPAEYFAEVIRTITGQIGARCIILGDEDDRPVAREITGQLRGEAVDLTGQTTLVDMAGVLSLTDLVITNDSGPMHLAAAVGTPVMAIFGPTTPSLGFAPTGSRDKIFQVSVDCRPCSVHGSRNCWRGDWYCLMEVKPDEVSAEAVTLMKEIRP